MQATQQQPKTHPDKASMEIYVVIAFALVVVVGGVIFYNGSLGSSQAVIKTPALSPAPTSETIIPPTIEQPIAAPQIAKSITVEQVVEPISSTPQENVTQVPSEPTLPLLPTLNQSDVFVLAKATQLSWLPNYAAALIPKEMLRNFVTFVDNLSRGDLATKFAPLKRPKQKFSVREAEGLLYLDESSYKRYNLYIDIINSLNIELALEHYQRLMPLIDEAYMELGYEKGTFNRTLTNAIDLMLAAPTIRGPIELVAPSAMYKFKDPQLEQLPAAQKLMLRIGPDNVTQLRPKLQQLYISLSEINF